MKTPAAANMHSRGNRKGRNRNKIFREAVGRSWPGNQARPAVGTRSTRTHPLTLPGLRTRVLVSRAPPQAPQGGPSGAQQAMLPTRRSLGADP